MLAKFGKFDGSGKKWGKPSIFTSSTHFFRVAKGEGFPRSTPCPLTIPNVVNVFVQLDNVFSLIGKMTRDF